MSYTLVQQFNSQHAHILFAGQFMGKAVIWDTQLFTVTEYARHVGYSHKTIRQCIKIEMGEKDSINLIVALNVPEINSPTIQKMMIMINQYKNLAVGCHEYGDVISLAHSQDSHI